MHFSPEELDLLARVRPKQALRWSEPTHHVFAIAVVDHGAEPGLGEARLGEDDDHLHALEQACRLARAASMRAGMLGLANGGGAIVIVRDPQREPAACDAMLASRLGEVPFRALVGPGLEREAEGVFALVRPDEDVMRRWRGQVLDVCLRPLFDGERGAAVLRSALVLGASPCGRDLAIHLAGRGVEVRLWDEQAARAHEVAEAAGVGVHEGDWPEAAVDLLVPCTSTAVVDEGAAGRVEARVIAGGVPLVFASAQARAVLEARGRRFVPEVLAGAADSIAVAEAVGGLDAAVAIERLAEAAAEVLREATGAHDRALSIAIARSKAAG